MKQPIHKYRLSRKNSLKSKIIIDKLFANGNTIVSFPIRIIYIADSDFENKILVGFSVPKHKFKKAVDRNRIKRLMREAYRLQQHNLKTKNIAMMWLYMSGKMPDYKEVYKSVGNIINLLNQKQPNGRT